MSKLEFKANLAREPEGLGHAGIETYKDTPYTSLARECGQNSADAGVKEPVLLEFKVLEIDSSEFPAKEQYQKAIEACLEKACSEKNEKEKQFFLRAKHVIDAAKIKVLEISDKNTTGLIGPADGNTKFNSLVKGAGVSNKDDETSGGSFGIGKNAVFTVSEIQAVIYSTLYCDDTGNRKFLCQGKTVLVSHEQDGRPLQATGYWGNDNFRPIDNANEVPGWLKRTEIGTSIFCLCFRDDENWHGRMIASLLANFFSAIASKRIEFIVNGKKVDRGSLTALFQDESIMRAAEDSGIRENLGFASLLYDCLGSTETLEKKIDLDTYGKFSIKLLLKDDLPKRVAIIRNGMFICDNLKNFGDHFSRFDNSKEFIALVQPEDKAASALFKQLENPRHDDLSAERLSDPVKRKEVYVKVKKLAKQIRDFINTETKVQLKDEQYIDELAEFFSDYDNIDDTKTNDPEEDNLETVILEQKPVKLRQIERTRDAGGGRNGKTETKINPDPKRDGKDTGNSGQSGKGDQETTGIEIQDVRNFQGSTDSRKREVFFTVGETGRLELTIDASGIAAPDKLQVVKTNIGQVNDGKIVVDVISGQRNQLKIEFSENYSGPIEVMGVISKEVENEDQ